MNEQPRNPGQRRGQESEVWLATAATQSRNHNHSTKVRFHGKGWIQPLREWVTMQWVLHTPACWLLDLGPSAGVGFSGILAEKWSLLLPFFSTTHSFLRRMNVSQIGGQLSICRLIIAHRFSQWGNSHRITFSPGTQHLTRSSWTTARKCDHQHTMSIYGQLLAKPPHICPLSDHSPQQLVKGSSLRPITNQVQRGIQILRKCQWSVNHKMTSLPLSLSVETYGWTISVTLPKEGCRVKMRCFLAWDNDCREKFIKRFLMLVMKISTLEIKLKIYTSSNAFLPLPPLSVIKGCSWNGAPAQKCVKAGQQPRLLLKLQLNLEVVPDLQP